MVIQRQGWESNTPLLNSTVQSEISWLLLFLKVLPQTGESPCKNRQVWLRITPSSKTVISPRTSFPLLSLLLLTWSMGISTCYHLSAVVKQRDTEHDIQLKHSAKQNFSCIFSGQGESEPSGGTEWLPGEPWTLSVLSMQNWGRRRGKLGSTWRTTGEYYCPLKTLVLWPWISQVNVIILVTSYIVWCLSLPERQLCTPIACERLWKVPGSSGNFCWKNRGSSVEV